MRILLHSNGPMANTGYGVQIGLLVDRLVKDGHEVAVSCNFGHQVGIKDTFTPAGNPVRLYPSRGEDVSGADIIHGHANHWFEGDKRAGWIIPLVDVFAMRNPLLKEFNVAAWTPVDHLLIPPAVLGFFDDTKALPVAMSQHGVREMTRAGLDPVYIPLAVDTSAYKPTPFIAKGGETFDARHVFHLPERAFVVGMVAMNKGNVFDRKGFSEAFYAFGELHRTHPNSVLFLHTDRFGFSGINLPTLARYAGIPETAVIYSDAYAYTIGFEPEMMAAAYTAMDVLLSPSHGEGFCVPLLEAQACGTPVIASNATAQSELVGEGTGWLVTGQPILDASQNSPAFCPSIRDIVRCLEEAFDADLAAMQAPCREWAKRYDADRVFDEYWRPFLAALDGPLPNADKPPMERVAVVVPAMRPSHVRELVDSFDEANDGTARLYFVVDPDNEDLIHEVDKAGFVPLISDRGSTFAQKANCGYLHTDEDWLFLCGEDVRFTPGWLDGPRELSTRWDVIGSNDAADGEVKNPDVAAGRHSDHWFTRRTYIDEQGACLEGPGQFCPEAYYHWWTDKEVIELAKARGVFSPCLESHVIHLHPGYDGREDLRAADPVYVKAVEWRDRDETTFKRRLPLIAQQQVGRR